MYTFIVQSACNFLNIDEIIALAKTSKDTRHIITTSLVLYEHQVIRVRQITEENVDNIPKWLRERLMCLIVYRFRSDLGTIMERFPNLKHLVMSCPVDLFTMPTNSISTIQSINLNFLNHEDTRFLPTMKLPKFTSLRRLSCDYNTLKFIESDNVVEHLEIFTIDPQMPVDVEVYASHAIFYFRKQMFGTSMNSTNLHKMLSRVKTAEVVNIDFKQLEIRQIIPTSLLRNLRVKCNCHVPTKSIEFLKMLFKFIHVNIINIEIESMKVDKFQ